MSQSGTVPKSRGASEPLRAPKQAKSVLTLDAVRLSRELPKVVREFVPELGFARVDSIR
ncbi:hypothetical protein SAMN04487914_13833 [Arthrobacter sp. ok909]|nr:hypothetical protein SAMN04487914_13833 [Arthrobacter sp. ok909]